MTGPRVCLCYWHRNDSWVLERRTTYLRCPKHGRAARATNAAVQQPHDLPVTPLTRPSHADGARPGRTRAATPGPTTPRS